jgi:methionine biosynthesis protein MetW
MNLKNFENQYWERNNQKFVFRHKAAVKFINDGRILDLGCGDGLFLDILKKKKVYGVGLDISEISVSKAREKGLDAKQFDFTKDLLPFENNSFDTVVMLDVLEHLYQPERILKEAHRVAKRNLVISVPNFNSFPARIQMVLGKTPENNKPRQGHIYWMSYKIIKKLLKDAGFEIQEIKVNSFFSKFFGLRNITQSLANFLPSIFALSFVIKAKKC